MCLPQTKKKEGKYIAIDNAVCVINVHDPILRFKCQQLGIFSERDIIIQENQRSFHVVFKKISLAYVQAVEDTH